jgi:chemotaxis signal transduction protein
MPAYVTLSVGAEAYAMPVGNVLEVAELGQVTAVPGARPELLGIRNLRGRILPVADLAGLLGIVRTEPPGRLVVAQDAGRRAGFAVAEVRAIGELPDRGQDTKSELLAGAALSGNDLVGVIDVTKVFDSLVFDSLVFDSLVFDSLEGTRP